MRTISNCVEEILASHPFLEEAISQNIINYSALAEQLQEAISLSLAKPVKTGAIMMALRRYNAPKGLGNNQKLDQMLHHLGNITVQSGLSDYTFKNSDNLIKCHSKIIESLSESLNVFYTFTRGVHESNVIISSKYQHHIDNFYRKEKCTGVQHDLSSITIGLPKHNTKISGLYYQFFKRLAWEGVSIYEVISTTNEFTIIVQDEMVDTAFSVIKKLKLSSK